VARSLRIRFLGGNEEFASDDPLLASLGDVVAMAPSRPHLEALAAMRRADALALLGHGGPADSLLYTGKIYEYATSGRPILAVVDEGPAAELLRAAGQRSVIPSNDAEKVALVLRDWVAAWRRGERVSSGVPEALGSAVAAPECGGPGFRILSEITT